MGHSERNGENLYKNVPDIENQQLLFRAAMEYFVDILPISVFSSDN
jgi:hypothetical protein